MFTQGDVQDVTLAVSRYFYGHNLKAQLDATWRHVQPDGVPSASTTVVDTVNWIVRLQITLQI